MLISGYYFQTLASFLGIAIDPKCRPENSRPLPVNAAIWAALNKDGMVAQRRAVAVAGASQTWIMWWMSLADVITDRLKS